MRQDSEGTYHRTSAVVAAKLELRVFLEVRDALVHIVTAVHPASGARTRLHHVVRTQLFLLLRA
eukprot:CAMPEP_0194487176 /NCGR_PEP_ID=MMETSP0253-20130528/7554_1 /TAXON_ID=2966 /ORGANISM="Noctiluca scintillans" /LENGTH=63 /DNA_ID=CAMNT_0039327361 /DNA_START=17 /DNA_END=206 /DNA_ORIENTATION=+